MPFKKPNKLVLFFISGLTFVISLWVFVFFLSSGSFTNEEAKASSYTADQVIVAVNKERKAKGLPELIKNEKLMASSENKAKHLADNQYFSHVHKESGRRWSDFIKEQSYEYSVAGENLANGFYTVPEMVKAWMDSPTHRENILNETVDETGIGVALGQLNGSPTIFVVQHFGKE